MYLSKFRLVTAVACSFEVRYRLFYEFVFCFIAKFVVKQLRSRTGMFTPIEGMSFQELSLFMIYGLLWI